MKYVIISLLVTLSACSNTHQQTPHTLACGTPFGLAMFEFPSETVKEENGFVVVDQVDKTIYIPASSCMIKVDK